LGTPPDAAIVVRVRKGGTSGRQVVVLAIALALLVEIPLVAYILGSGDDSPSVAAREGPSLGGGSS